MPAQFVKGEFTETFDPTLLEGFRKSVVVDDRQCLIDTQELGASFDSQSGEQAMRECDGAILLYDITSRESFDHVRGYCEKLRSLKDSHVPLYLVGNKRDSAVERKVKISEGKETAETLDPRCPFIEGSAKTAESVEHIFFNLIREIRRHSLDSELKKSITKRSMSLGLGGTGSAGKSPKEKGLFQSIKQIFVKSN